MDVTLVVRVVIVALALTATTLVVLSSRAGWRDTPLTEGFAVTRLGVAGVLLAVAYGTAESHVLAVPPAPRMWVLMVALSWLNYGLITRIRATRGARPKEK
ncbi:hypothetical protein FDO65_10160 [Nakamurella flava]|uniref:Uncharacterized protein n=1 Tax=Nakamurella flava TaxID=2576308 RepID=A0A4U6QNV2_9ACTN|nr:hypothetical protein [Nakamurella flava]TKV61878.1 hypothetical protein FDO65_10160 [Nakamurella flava]